MHEIRLYLQGLKKLFKGIINLSCNLKEFVDFKVMSLCFFTIYLSEFSPGCFSPLVFNFVYLLGVYQCVCACVCMLEVERERGRETGRQSETERRRGSERHINTHAHTHTHTHTHTKRERVRKRARDMLRQKSIEKDRFKQTG